MNALNTFSNSDPDKKYCTPCRKKIPPIETILKVGENTTDYRHNRGDYSCDDCNRERQKKYRTNKGQYTKYENEKDEADLLNFEEEWNDIQLAKRKELSDKTVLVWDKNDRRRPKDGLKKDTICSVMWPELWNVEADIVVNDMLDSRNEPPSVRLRHKDTLLKYIPNVIDAFREHYRDQARNKWDGLVDAVNNKYAGKEKLVATPEYRDPRTKKSESRWFLLSHEDELDQRTERHKIQQERIPFIIEQEEGVVAGFKKIEEERREKERAQEQKERNSESKKESNTDDESNEAGE